MDAQGNLFGTTIRGSTDNNGSVFEIPYENGTYGSLVTLLSFSGTNATGSYPNGATPYGGLFFDASGDIFGTTLSGGAYGQGTIFEIPKTAGGYVAPTSALVSFQSTADDSYEDPYGPYAGIIIDSNGDLLGTTLDGGGLDSNNQAFGTVYEVPYSNGSSGTPQNLVQFNGHGTNTSGFTNGNGRGPTTPLIADAAGNLSGTAEEGSNQANSQGLPYDHGVVFEIPKTTNGFGTLKVSASFTDEGGATPGADPQSGLTIDNHGNLFGTTFYGNTDGTTTFGQPSDVGHGVRDSLCQRQLWLADHARVLQLQ